MNGKYFFSSTQLRTSLMHNLGEFETEATVFFFYHDLTVVDSSKSSISKFVSKIKIIGGFLKLSIGENRHSKVDTSVQV